MNVRFVLRGALLAIPAALLLLALGLWLQTPWARSPDPTPPPPTILAPAGAMPSGPVGLRAYARYRGEGYLPVGSGFFLLLDGGDVVGVTAAHTVILDDPGHPLASIALGIAGHDDFFGEFDTLRGAPGRPLAGADLTVDYLLLAVDVPLEPEMLLRPDERGGPQPGERVWLVSGLGDGRLLEGTVQSATGTAVWVLMDRTFDPGQMSGSPLVSQHTGRAVGMALAASPRRGGLLIGAHPIGSLVRLAEAAGESPRLGR
ncbi:MAG: hypothetical protein ACK2UY_14125 [Anaerolineae bacterium]